MRPEHNSKVLDFLVIISCIVINNSEIGLYLRRCKALLGYFILMIFYFLLFIEIP
jgi:hypothetical protein